MTRVRFAPAPTGFLHIGGARTYIFNWLFARKAVGQVVLRIDDTDIERSSGESLQSILDGLTWLELPWDEMHHQSDRRALHAQAAAALLAKGAAYRDFTPERREETAGDEQSGGPWLCNPAMREMPPEESGRRAAAGEGFVVRFRVPREAGGGVKFKDLVYRDQFRKIGDLEDFALLRSNGSPTYHLASTVDDAELKISHIIRGQDHLSNTYKHILLFEALGFQPPQFGHLPLLLGPDGSKLSKRKHGPIVSVTTYRDRGFLPQGFVNYLSLLGWSPKDNREVLTLEDLRELFSVEGILRTNAVVSFDEASEENWTDPKALWINSQHLRTMPVEALLPYVRPLLQEAGWWKPAYEGAQSQWLTQTVELLRARFNTLRDFQTRAAAYFGDSFAIDPQALKNLDKEGARELLRKLAGRLASLEDFTEQSVEQQVREFAAESNVKPGLIINASRAALTGQPVGPSAFAIFGVLGKERVIERLRRV
jgi:glutamyl-tRNA synthetase